MKNFLICKGNPTEGTEMSFCAIQLAIERLFKQSGHGINHFTVNYLDSKGKRQTKSSTYNAGQRNNISLLSINNCKMIMFSETVADLSIQNIACSAIVLPVENDVFLKFVWYKNTSMKFDFREFVETAQKHIQQVLHIEYLTAGRMEASKNVEMFVQGILSDSRTDYENKIAKAIQMSTYIDKKIPFLFPYTFQNELKQQEDSQSNSGKMLYFGDLVDVNFENFSRNERWLQWNRTLKENSMLVM